MKTLTALIVAALSLAACSESHGADALRLPNTSDAGSDGVLSAPPQAEPGPPPPPPSEEEVRHQRFQECAELGTAAWVAFDEARADVAVDQCNVTADCNPPAKNSADFWFNRYENGCWDSCGGGIPGTKEYVDALKGVADDACAAFRDEECEVISSGCPLVALPKTWTCEDRECVVHVSP